MKTLFNSTTGHILASRARVAERWLEQTIGLLLQRRLGAQDALWLPRRRSIHTLGMLDASDVVFLDAEDRVVRLLPKVPANRPLIVCVHAHAVVQLAGGSLSGSDVLIGDRLALR